MGSGSEWQKKKRKAEVNMEERYGKEGMKAIRLVQMRQILKIGKSGS